MTIKVSTRFKLIIILFLVWCIKLLSQMGCTTLTASSTGTINMLAAISSVSDTLTISGGCTGSDVSSSSFLIFSSNGDNGAIYTVTGGSAKQPTTTTVATCTAQSKVDCKNQGAMRSCTSTPSLPASSFAFTFQRITVTQPTVQTDCQLGYQVDYTIVCCGGPSSQPTSTRSRQPTS